MSAKDERFPPQPGAGLPTPELMFQEIDYDSPYLVVTRAVKRMPSGQEATFYLRREADVAVCLPVTTDGRFIMVEEYRHGPGQWLFEIPAGNVDPDEDAAVAGAREVLEETGYAGDLIHLCTTWIAAYSSARKHIYLMRNARKVATPEMAASDLFRVAEMTRTQFESIVRTGALTDLDAGMACLDRLDNENSS
jgi:ADP-ribose pyrophosphatase